MQWVSLIYRRMLKYIGILELVYLFLLYSVGIHDIPTAGVANVAIRANVVRKVVVVVVEARRAKVEIFLAWTLSRRNLTHFRLHNYPLLLQYMSHLWNNLDQSCPESSARRNPNTHSSGRRRDQSGKRCTHSLRRRSRSPESETWDFLLVVNPVGTIHILIVISNDSAIINMKWEYIVSSTRRVLQKI